jgi:hypothetical protein
VGWPHGDWGLERGAEASSSRAGPQPRARGVSTSRPPLRRRPGGASIVGGGPRSRRLAQPSAERGAADPRRPSVACFPGETLLVFLLIFVVPVLTSRGATLTGFRLLAAGARAPRPRQVRRPRPNERRTPRAPGAARRSRSARGGPEDPGRLAVVPGGGPARPAPGAEGAGRGASPRHRADLHSPHRSG